MNNAVAQIKERITIFDLFDKYGYLADRRGFIACPFHDEDTPSLGVFAEGKAYNCFGCGRKGDVFAFVMELFHLNFAQAVMRIDTDFGLGLVGQKADPAVLAELRQKRAFVKWEKNIKDDMYKRISARFRAYRDMIRNYHPQAQDEHLNPMYVEALHYVDWCEYWLEQHR